jgi:valyl-tRNA synthetase
LIGSEVVHPLTGISIPIVADEELVDPEWGTGVVKVDLLHILPKIVTDFSLDHPSSQYG